MSESVISKESFDRLLVAVTGNSPAILTETVWALAHQEEPWIPDKVVIITTSTGREKAKELLIEQKGWVLLCTALLTEKLSVEDKLAFGSSDSIHVIGDGRRDFDDISTPAESSAASDFMLSVLRQYTEQPDTEIMASIAGGRKAMSALMLACMSLLGREQDRVCHVLADDFFISNHRDFLFPQNAQEAKAARIQLYEIPFVRVRGWYEQESGKLPASYSHMVSLFRTIAPEAVVEPPVVLDLKTGVLSIGGTELELTRTEFDVAQVFIQSRNTASAPEDRTVKEHDDNFRRALSRVRKKVAAVMGKTLATRLIPDLRKTKYEYRTIQIKDGRPKTS